VNKDATLWHEGVQVIIVSDDDDEAVQQKIPRSILAQLTPSTVLMSNDSLRMYVRQSHWDAMKDSFALANK